MRISFFFFFLFSYAALLFTASGQSDASIENEPNWIKAVNHINKQEYDSAIYYYSKSLKVALCNSNNVLEVKTRLKLIDCYFYKNDFTGAFRELETVKPVLDRIQDNNELKATYMASLAYYHYSRKEYTEAEILFQKLAKTTNEKQPEAYVYLASIYSEQAKVDKAVYYLTKVLKSNIKEIWIKYSNDISYATLTIVENIAKSGYISERVSVYNIVNILSVKDTFINAEARSYYYYCLGLIHACLEDYRKSNSYVLKAISELQTRESGSRNLYMAYYNNTIANNLYRISDYSKAEKYFEQAIHYSNAGNYLNDRIQFYYWYSYARNAYGCKQYYKTLTRLDSALQYTHLVGNNENASLYNCYGLTYTKLKEYDKAEGSYKKAVDIRQREKIINIKNLSKDYQNYSELLVKMGKEEDAVEMGKESCCLIKQVMGERSGSTSLALSSLGGIYSDCGMYIESLETYNAAILATSSDTILLNDLFPGPDKIVYTAEYIRALKGKAMLLYKIAGMDEANRKAYLLQSLVCYLETIKQMEKLRSGYQFDEGKLMLAENERYVYNEALQVVSDLFFINNDRNYLHIAFNIAERAKAAVLLGKVSLLSDISGNGRYDRLFMLDQRIRKEISACENYTSDSRSVNDQKGNIKERLFKLYEFQERFYSVLKADFPEYYETWVNPSYASLQQIQRKLKEDECLVEYHLADSVLYTFVVSPGDCKLYRKELTADFEDNIMSFIKSVESSGPEAITANNYKRFTELSYSLYKVLLESFENSLQGKSLIIAGDNMLNYIPFEVLLTTPSGKERMDYRALPYLLKEHSVSYTGSSTVYCYNNSRRKGQGRSILAFAPDYQNPGEKTKEALKEVNGYTLKGASDEVKGIGEIYDGAFYIGYDATENSFKKISQGYGVLHLAMHGESDPENPFNSKLIFERGGEDDDGILYAWEIYNTQINPEMVVLSACNTGTGKLRDGEGVMSLARAFMYAGSPCVVMTLWTVSDLSSTDIMKKFYYNLSDGDDKALALQKAKIDYLNEAGAMNAHPGFWAGYVVVGDRLPLAKEGWGRLYIILLTVVIVFVVITYRIRRTK